MIQWVAFGLHTGNSIASLPGLLVDYPITRTVGQYDTATAHLIIDGTQPSNWLDATKPGAALLACYDDEDDSSAIQWAGYVNTRTRTAETDTIDLSMVTAEGYLDRRIVVPSPDPFTYASVGQNLIVKTLVEDYVITGAYPGLPMTVVYTDPGNDGAIISQTYRDADNGTVYEAVNTIAALDGGPEWMINWVWRADMGGLRAIFYVGDRVGTPTPASGSPAAVFEMPGALISATLTEDYSTDKGANAVRAYTSVGGLDPSAWQAVADDRPRYEHSFEPLQGNSVTSGQLTSFARKALRNMRNGGRAIALVADRRTAPAFGTTWQLGDDIGYVIGGLADDGGDTVPTFPGGLIGTERVIGVQLALDTISPIAEVPE